MVLRVEGQPDVPIEWPDVAPTGREENGRKIFRHKQTGQEGIKILSAELEFERIQEIKPLHDWLAARDGDVTDEDESMFGALLEAFK